MTHMRKKKTVRKRRTTYTSRSAVVRARGSNHTTFAALDNNMFSWLSKGGDSGPLELPAAPGLMTVVDLALYRSLEGELPPTICSARALLTVWLYVKEQAQTVLASSSAADYKTFPTPKAFLFHCVPSLAEDDSSAPFDG